MQLNFVTVDVFTGTQFVGNPLAVCRISNVRAKVRQVDPRRGDVLGDYVPSLIVIPREGGYPVRAASRFHF
jgi:hypothetical protein